MKRTRKAIVAVLFILLLTVPGFAAMNNTTYSISIGAAVDTAVAAVINLSKPMMAFQAIVTIPNTTNGVTFTITLTDASDRLIKTIAAAVADNDTYTYKPGTSVAGGYKLKVLPSGVTGNAIVVTAVVTYAD